MSTEIDNKVVSMEFDNSNFERNVSTSMSTIDKLKQALNFDGSEKGLDNLSSAAGKMPSTFSGFENAVDAVKVKFSALEVVAISALSNITNKAINAGEQLVKSLTVDQISAGWTKYSQETSAVQSIMASTGKSIDEVTESLKKLGWYSDETSYSYTDMADNVGSFVRAGIDLDDAVDEMMGFANVAALAGAQGATFKRALIQLSQGMGVGYFMNQDWGSLETSGIATIQFKERILENAAALGQLLKVEDQYFYRNSKGEFEEVTAAGLRQSLREKWLTKEVMAATLSEYSTYANAIYDISDSYDTASEAMAAFNKTGKNAGMELSETAFRAAQEAISFSQVVDALKDSTSTAFKDIFKSIFGDYLEAKTLWTSVVNSAWDIFTGPVVEIGEVIDQAFDAPVDNFKKRLEEAGLTVEDLENALRSIAKENKIDIDALIKEYGSFSDALKAGAFSAEDSASGTSLLSKALNKLAGDAEKGTESVKKSTKSLEDYKKIVHDVVRGDFGNGAARVKALTAAGWDYNTVQNMVNVAWDGSTLRLDKLTAAMANLSEEELKSKGYTEEEIEAIRALAEEASEAGSPLNELIGSFGEKSGRELFGESLLNILEAISTVLTSVKEGFAEAFSGDELAEGILGLLKRFNELTSKLIPSEEAADKLRRTFAGLFSVVKLVKDAISAVIKVITTLAGKILGFTGGHLLDLTAGIGDVLVAFKNWAEGLKAFSIEKITNAFDGIQSKFPKISSAFDNIKNSISSAVSSFSNGTNPIVNFFESIKNGSSESDKAATSAGKVQKAVDTVSSAYKNTTKAIREQAAEMGKQVSVSDTTAKVSKRVSNALTVVSDACDKSTKSVKANKDNASKWAEIYATVSGIMSKIGGYISDKWAKFKQTDFVGSLVSGFNKLRDLVTNVFYIFSKLYNRLSKSSSVQKAVSGIKSLFSSFKEKSSTAVHNMIDAITSFIDKLASLDDFSLDNIIAAFEEFKKKILAALEIDSDKLSVSSLFSKIRTDATAGFSELENSFSDITKKLQDYFGNNPVFQFLEKFASRLRENLENLGLGNILSIIFGGSVLGIAKSLSDAAQNISSPLAALTDIFARLEGTIKAYQKELKAETLKDIAIAIGILAGSLWLIAQIPGDRLVAAGIALGSLAGGLVILAGVLAFINKKSNLFNLGGDLLTWNKSSGLTIKGVLSAVLSLLIIATAIKTVVSAFKSINEKDLEDVEKKLLVLGSLFTMLALFGIFVGRFSKINLSMGGGLLASVVSLLIVIRFLDKLDEVKPDAILNNLAGFIEVIAVLGILMAMTRLMGKEGAKAGLGLLGAVLSLYLIIPAIKNVVELLNDPAIGEKKIWKAVAVIGALMAGLAALMIASHWANNEGTKVGIGILLMSLAINVLVNAVSNFAKMNVKSLAKGLAAVAIAIGGIALVLRMSKGAGKGVGGASVAIAAIVAVLAILTGIFATYKATDLFKAVGAIVIILGMLALVFRQLGQMSSIGAAVPVALGFILGIIVAIGGVIGYLATKFRNASDALIIAASLDIVLAAVAGLFVAINKFGASTKGSKFKVIGKNLLSTFGELEIIIVAIGEIAAILGGLAAVNSLNNVSGGEIAALAAGIDVALGGVAGIMASLKYFGPKLGDGMKIITQFGQLSSIVGVIAEIAAVLAIFGYYASKYDLSGLDAIGYAVALDIVLAGIVGVVFVLSKVGQALVDGAAGVFGGAGIIAALGAIILVVAGIYMLIIDGLFILQGLIMGSDKFKTALANVAATIVAIVQYCSVISDEMSAFSEEDVQSAANFSKFMLALAAAFLGITFLTGISAFMGGIVALAMFAGEMLLFGASVKKFSEITAGVDPEQVSKVVEVCKKLIDLGSNVETGNGPLLTLFDGFDSLGAYAVDLSLFGAAVESFNSSLSGISAEDIATLELFTKPGGAAEQLINLSQVKVDTGNGIFSIFTGLDNLGGLAPQLAMFGAAIGSFYDSIATVDDVSKLENLVPVAASLAELSTINIDTGTGIFAFLTGSDNLAGLSPQLAAFGGAIAAFNLATADITDTSHLSAIAEIASTLASIGAVDIDTGNGLFSLLVGSDSLVEFGVQLALFGTQLVNFQNNTADLDIAEVSKAIAITQLLLGIDFPESGGLLSVFKADDDPSTFGKEVAKLARKLVEVGEEGAKLDLTGVDNIITYLGKLTSIEFSEAGGFVSMFIADDDPSTFGREIKNLAEHLVDAFDDFGKILKDEPDFDGIKRIVGVLSEIAGISFPATGGFVSMFKADADPSSFARDISLAADSLKATHNSLKGIEANDLKATAEKVKDAMTTLAGCFADKAMSIPETGGFVSTFTADADPSTFARDISTVASKLKAAHNDLKGIKADDLKETVTKLKDTFSVLAGFFTDPSLVIPETGGILSWFSKNNDPAKFGSTISSIAYSLKLAHNHLKNIKSGDFDDDLALMKNAYTKMASLGTDEVGADISGDITVKAAGLMVLAEGLKDIGKALKDFASDVGKAKDIDVALDKVKQAMELVGVKSIANTEGIDKASEAVQKITDKTNNLLKTVNNATSIATADTTSNADKVTKAATDAISQTADALSSAGGLAEKAAQIKQQVTDSFDFTSALEGLKNGSLDLSTFLSSLDPSSLNELGTALTGLDFSTLGEGFTGDLTQAFNGMDLTEIENILGTKLTELGGGASEGLAAGLSAEDKIALITAASNDNVSTIVDTITNGLDINSPSHVTEELGKGAGEGLELGLTESAGEGGIVYTASQALGQSVIDGIKEKLSAESLSDIPDSIASAISTSSDLDASLSASGRAVAGGLAQGITNNKAQVKSAGSTLVQTAATAAKGAKGQMSNAGRILGKAFADAIKSHTTTSKNAGQALAKAATDAAGSNAVKSAATTAGGNVVAGFIKGMNDGAGSAENPGNTNTAYGAGYALGQKAVQGVNKGAGNESPSHLTYQSGIYIGQGFVNGMSTYSDVVGETAYDMGSTAVTNLSDALSAITDEAYGMTEYQPTIRPVLDLSEVRNGAGQISTLLGQRQASMVGAEVNAMISGRQAQATERSSQLSALAERVNALSNSEAENYLATIAANSKKDIYLDNRVLVGELSPGVDTTLGNARFMASRHMI